MSFTYGADGLRRSQTGNDVVTCSVLNGQSVVREGRFVDPQWVTTATYLHGPRGTCRRCGTDAVPPQL